MGSVRFGALARVSLCFMGGVLGALVNSAFVWGMGASGVNEYLGIQIAPPLTWTWFRPRLVWGGLWALLVLPPPIWDRLLKRPWLWGMVLSVLPTLNQWLYVFPELADAGRFGLQLGRLTPLLVVVANALWGLVAVYWVKLAVDETLFSPRDA